MAPACLPGNAQRRLQDAVDTAPCNRPSGARHHLPGKPAMLWTVAIVLIVLWALGLVSSYTLGGFIHILIVVAIIIVLVQVIQGRR
jgi:low affinity Fe/Cu permease